MRFQSVKKPTDIKLEGITVEMDYVDKGLQSVILTDARGNKLRVIVRSYTLHAEVPSPPETEKKHKLSGSVIGLPVEKLFDSKWEAEEEKSRLESGASSSTLLLDEVEVEIPF